MGGQKTDKKEYGLIKKPFTAMLTHFDQFLSSPEAPQPQLVVDAYLNLAEMAQDTRPTRTVVGIDYGVLPISDMESRTDF